MKDPHIIEEGILKFVDARRLINKPEFDGQQLKMFVQNVTPGIIQDVSILRTLRKMRERNIINYDCVDPQNEKYVLL